MSFTGIFKNPQDEDKLCQVLKAFVEEWGPEYVIVSVPKFWKDYGETNLGRVRLEFTTNDTVSIRVEHDLAKINFAVGLL